MDQRKSARRAKKKRILKEQTFPLYAPDILVWAFGTWPKTNTTNSKLTKHSAF
jgi:hypothetical protein